MNNIEIILKKFKEDKLTLEEAVSLLTEFSFKKRNIPFSRINEPYQKIWTNPFIYSNTNQELHSKLKDNE